MKVKPKDFYYELHSLAFYTPKEITTIETKMNSQVDFEQRTEPFSNGLKITIDSTIVIPNEGKIGSIGFLGKMQYYISDENLKGKKDSIDNTVMAELIYQSLAAQVGNIYSHTHNNSQRPYLVNIPSIHGILEALTTFQN